MSRVWKEKFNGENYENSYEGKKIMSKVWKQKFNGEDYGNAYERYTTLNILIICLESMGDSVWI